MPQDRAPNVETRVQVSPRFPVSRESQELATLEMRRGELKSQLQSNTERRALLNAQMQDAEGNAKAAIARRISALDERTARIDDELTAIDDRVSALMARGVTPPPSRFDRLLEGGFSPPAAVGPGAVGHFPNDPFDSEWGVLFGGMLAMQAVTFVLLGVALWRSFKRQIAPRLAADDVNRLEQLQRSVDVMAVEVERISESQRFTTKLLNEQSGEPRVSESARRGP